MLPLRGSVLSSFVLVLVSCLVFSPSSIRSVVEAKHSLVLPLPLERAWKYLRPEAYFCGKKRPKKTFDPFTLPPPNTAGGLSDL